MLFDGMLSTDFFYAHIYLFPKLNEYIKECLVNHENKENICPTIVAALHLDETRVHARHLLSNKTYYFGPKWNDHSELAASTQARLIAVQVGEKSL